MCLALPMRITAVDGTQATIAAEGLQQRCSIMLVPEAGVGDYVLVHAGYAISVIDEAEAQETFELLREMDEFDARDESAGRGSASGAARGAAPDTASGAARGAASGSAPEAARGAAPEAAPGTGDGDDGG